MKLLKCFFLSIFFFLVHSTIIAQDCNCPEFAKMKADHESSQKDHFEYTGKLLASKNIICQAKAYEWIAIELMDEEKFDSSDLCFQKAEILFKQSKCSDSILLNTYKNWAQLFYTKGEFVKAQDKSLKLIGAAEAGRLYYDLAVGYTMVAQLFNQTNQPDQGIIYARKAVPYIEQIKEPAKKIDLLFKLSKRYLWHYQDTKTATSLDTSELFSYQLLEIAKPINKKSSISKAFSNLQGIAWEKGDLKTAIIFLDSSFKYIDANSYADLATNYYDKADILYELKDYKQAVAMADSAIHYYKELNNTIYVADAYNLSSKIYQASGDYKKAFEYKEISRAVTDSLRDEERTKEVAELEKKYNQAKNEKTIEQLAQQKRIYLLLAVAGLFALLGLIFFIRQQSLKNKQKIMEAEQRLNRARINPHFFFNALSSLQSYALEGNDGRSIATNLSKFSHIMRETLESSYKEYVTIEQETDFLKEYLELQKIRYPEKFSYEINISPEIEPDDTLIPSMILQPFAENSIEHGFNNISYLGLLTISFYKKEKDLVITIVDNGKGLIQSVKMDTEHISRASQIIKDRIYLLNIKLKTRASFTIENNKEKGVIVTINLPGLQKRNI